MKKVLWGEMRRSEFKKAAKAGAIVIIPVVSMEQYQDHLPVNTGTNSCGTIAQGIAPGQ